MTSAETGGQTRQSVQAKQLPPWRHFVGALLRHSFEAVALIIAILVIAGAGLAWRLSQGPISLNAFRGDLSAALARALDADQAQIQSAEAIWSPSDGSLIIALVDVQASDTDGQLVAAAPRLEAGLRPWQLLQGRLAFSRLTAEGGEVSVVRDIDGRFAAGFGPPERVLSRMGATEDVEFDVTQLPRALRSLQSISLRRASLNYVDQRLGLRVEVADAGIELTRAGEDISLIAEGRAPAAGEQAAIVVSATIANSMTTLEAEVTIADVYPARILDAAGPLGLLSRFDAPVTLTAAGGYGEGGAIKPGRLVVEMGEGRMMGPDGAEVILGGRIETVYDTTTDTLIIADSRLSGGAVSGTFSGEIQGLSAFGEAVPLNFDLQATDLAILTDGFFPEPLRFDALAAKGMLTPSRDTITFDHIHARAVGLDAELSGSATLQDAGDDRRLPALQLQGAATGAVEARELLAFWPQRLSPEARSWVESSLLAGRLSDVRLMLDLPATAWLNGALDNDDLEIQYAYQDATVILVEGMSPLTRARGTTMLRGNSLRADLAGGEIAGITVTSGYADIAQFRPEGMTPAEAREHDPPIVPIGRFGAAANGEAINVLSFVDEPPLAFISGFGLSPDVFGGRGSLELELSRPLGANIPPEDITFAIEAAFEDASGPGALPGLDLSEATVAMSVTNAGIDADIEGLLGPAPAKIRWRQKLDPVGAEAPDATQFHIESEIDSALLDSYGVPSRSTFAGNAPIIVETTGRGLEIARADVSIDLTSAALALPGITEWTKPVGQAAQADFVFRGGADGLLRFDDVRFRARGASFEGGGVFAEDFQVQSFDIDAMFVRGLVDVAASGRRDDQGKLYIDVEGTQFDARWLLPIIAQPPEKPEDAEIGSPVRIEARLQHVQVTPTDVFSDISLSVDHAGDRVDSLALEAQSADGPVSVLIFPIDDVEGRLFRVRAPNAGVIMEALYDTQQLRGGRMEVDGVLPAPFDEDAAGAIELRIRDFDLVEAPILARILSLASIRGLSDAFSRDGRLTFDRLHAPIVIRNDVWLLDEVIMSGPSIGMTINGEMVVSENTVDLSGVLAPAYGVNSMFGDIPLLGSLFVSREGEGLLGVTFTVRGPLEETRVTVNPLSAFAPGILRRMFEPAREDLSADRWNYSALPPAPSITDADETENETQ